MAGMLQLLMRTWLLLCALVSTRIITTPPCGAHALVECLPHQPLARAPCPTAHVPRGEPSRDSTHRDGTLELTPRDFALDALDLRPLDASSEVTGLQAGPNEARQPQPDASADDGVPGMHPASTVSPGSGRHERRLLESGPAVGGGTNARNSADVDAAVGSGARNDVAARSIGTQHSMRALRSVNASATWPTGSKVSCVKLGAERKACRFMNLVYDREARVFKVVASARELEEMQKRFPGTKKAWLNIMDHLVLGLTTPQSRKTLFPIAYADEPFPRAEETCEEAESSYLHYPFNGLSFGHILRDNFSIIASILHELGVSDTNHKLLIADRLSDVFRKYSSYIATSVHTFDEYVGQCDRRFILFRSFVAAHGRYVRDRELRKEIDSEIHNCTPTPFLTQRKIALRLAGLPVVNVSQIPFIRILLLDREPTDKRRINNIPDLLPPLRKRFPHAQVVSHSLLHLNPRDQLKYLSQTSILVSTIGSASFRLIYLPTNAHVILMGAPEHVVERWKTRAISEVTSCWSHIQYVTTGVYHVTQDEEYDMRAPAHNGNPWIALRNSDIHVNDSKLADLLDPAIERIHSLKVQES